MGLYSCFTWAEYLFTSPALRGPLANWSLIPGTLFSSNWTVETPLNPASIESHEVRRQNAEVNGIGPLYVRAAVRHRWLLRLTCW